MNFRFGSRYRPAIAPEAPPPPLGRFPPATGREAWQDATFLGVIGSQRFGTLGAATVLALVSWLAPGGFHGFLGLRQVRATLIVEVVMFAAILAIPAALVGGGTAAFLFRLARRDRRAALRAQGALLGAGLVLLLFAPFGAALLGARLEMLAWAAFAVAWGAVCGEAGGRGVADARAP